MALPKKYYDKKNKILSVPPQISKTKKWYHFLLCETAIELIETMMSRHPENEFLFPNHGYEQKIKRWEGKLAEGNTSKYAKEPTKYMFSEMLLDNVESFCLKYKVEKFLPRDFRRTFKTLAGQLKITKEIHDRIQHHSLHDVSSVHYDRYDYNEEKLEALLKWECKLHELINS